MSRIHGVESVDGNHTGQSSDVEHHKEKSQKNSDFNNKRKDKFKFHIVNFEVTEERNALERVLVQFANYEKTTVYDEESNKYFCTMKYNAMDETEVLIMLLSFGPTIKITGPGRFLNLFKERVFNQNKLLEDQPQ